MRRDPLRAINIYSRGPKRVNPRGCPGSLSTVPTDSKGYGVCPFCNNDYKVRADGRIKLHARRAED